MEMQDRSAITGSTEYLSVRQTESDGKAASSSTLYLNDRDHLDPKNERSSSTPPTIPFLSPDAWLFDALSLAFAALVLIAIIILLSQYDKKPNPLWYSGITLNTILSFASLFFRAAILFPIAHCISQLCWIWFSEKERPLSHMVLIDQASRGPLGGLYTLYAGIWSALSVLGVVATLITLAVGPFFQQSIAFYSARSIDYDIPAYASTARTYTSNLSNPNNGPAAYEWFTPYNMKSAMYTGLLSSGMMAAPNAPFSCPTGNCTWDPFPSLAIGIQCIDMSSYYTLDCSSNFTAAEWPADACRIAPTKNNISSIWLDDYAKSPFKITLRPRESPMTLMFLGTSHETSFKLPPKTWTVKPTGGLAEIAWARAIDLHIPDYRTDPFMPPYINKNSKVESGMCILYSKMQVISAAVENGVYSETILRDETTISSNATALSDEESLNLNAPIEYSFKPDCNANPSAIHCNATDAKVALTRKANMYLLSAVNNLFTENKDKEQNVTITMGGATFGPLMMKMLYQAANVTQSMENLAYYMTIALRSNDTTLALQQAANPLNTTNFPENFVAPSHRVQGYAYVNQVHVRVTWAWLSAPALLLVLTAALLVGTMVGTREREVGIWKDNPLALLLHAQWRGGEGGEGLGRTEEDRDRTGRDIGRKVEGLRARVVGTRIWVGGREFGDR